MPDDELNVADPERPCVVVWFDDDAEVFERVREQLKREEPRITAHLFPAFETLQRDATEVARYSREVPFLAFVAAHSVPKAGDLIQALDTLEVRGVISDLQIGGDSLAGLTLLSNLSSLRSRPTLALCSSHIDPSIERLARGIGITALVEKRDVNQLVALLHNLLNLRQFAASRRVQYVTSERDELRRQNSKLQREKRALKRQLSLVQLRSRNTKPVKSSTGATGGTSQADSVHRLRQMVLSHNHDLSNTSSLTLTTLEHLCADTNVIPPILLADLQRARIAAKHCDILVQSLASISGNEIPASGEPSLIEAVVSQACEIIARKVPNSVSIKTEIADRLPACSIPGHLLIRAILNLLLNALESMPRGGALTIAARRLRNKTKPIVLKVSDSGTGIKKNDLNKVFTTKFSTKGKGHGFGLFIVQQIVSEYGGTVSISSARSKGTTVCLELPAL